MRRLQHPDKMVAHQLVRGLEDLGTQEKVLAHAATHKNLDLDGRTKFVEAQEMGARSSKLLGGGANVSKISDYQRSRSNTLQGKMKTHEESNEEKDAEDTCYCGYSGHGRRPQPSVRKSKCPACNKDCKSCQKPGHFSTVCTAKTKAITANSIGCNVPQDSELYELTSPPTRPRHKKTGMRVLSHVAMNRFGEWEAQNPDTQPSILVSVSVCDSGYDKLAIPRPRDRGGKKTVTALPDSGAQVTVGGPDLIHTLGVTKNKLIPVSQQISAANNGQLTLLGGILLDISGKDKDGKTYISSQLVYIADGVKKLLLSKRACVDLGILPESFPTFGDQTTYIPVECDTIQDVTCNMVSVEECTADPEERTKCSSPALTVGPHLQCLRKSLLNQRKKISQS